MIILTDKVDVETLRNSNKTSISSPDSEQNSVVDTEASDVGLSQQAQNLSYLYQQSLRFATQHTPPVYLGFEKRIEAITAAVHKLAAQSGFEYSAEQVKRVVNDVVKETHITALPPANVNAGRGSVYSFLAKTDQEHLANAYQHALDNNTSLDDVRFAAFSLARARYIEAKINAGTSWAVHSPKENSETQLSDEAFSTKLEPTHRNSGSDYVKTLRQQLQNGELFQSNPYLKSLLIQDVTQALLMNRLADFLSTR